MTSAAAVASTALLLALLSPVASATEIYKCEDVHGNVAYRETPCPEVSGGPDETAADATPAEDSFYAPHNPQPLATARERTPQDIDACKQPLRDAIDLIEAEMLRGYPAGEGEEFKAKLIELTQRMRACE